MYQKGINLCPQINDHDPEQRHKCQLCHYGWNELVSSRRPHVLNSFCRMSTIVKSQFTDLLIQSLNISERKYSNHNLTCVFCAANLQLLGISCTSIEKTVTPSLGLVFSLLSSSTLRSKTLTLSTVLQMASCVSGHSIWTFFFSFHVSPIKFQPFERIF